MTRREAREKTFKILFSIEFTESEDMKEQVEFAFDETIPADDDEPFDLLKCSEEDKEYVSSRVLDIVDKKEEIDAVISEISEGWKINRIGKAELAILRLAVYEIKFDEDIPDKVAVNEAVELAKAYCDESAKSYINAILAKLMK